MSDFPAIPEPIADLNSLADVARALKEAVEVMSGRRGSEEDFREAVSPIIEAAATSVTRTFTAGGGLDLDDTTKDALLDDAARRAAKYVEQSQIELQGALTELQTALDNFRRGVSDENADIEIAIEEISSQVEENTASISTESLTRATEVSALAGQIFTVQAVAGDNAAAISQEAIARANADGAIGARIDTITAVDGSDVVYVQSTQPTATAVGEIWVDTANGNLIKEWDGFAWLAQPEATLGIMAAAIGTESIARANEDSAISTRIDTLVSVSGDGNTATINSVDLTTATRTDALAQTLSEVEAMTEAGTANGYWRLTASSSPGDGAAAEFAVEVKASELGSFGSAGMRIQAFGDGSSRIKMSADQFLITDGSGNYTPFAIAGGDLIANAIIAAGNVDGLGAMGLIDKLTAANLATYMDTAVISTAYIGNLQVTNAKIANLAVDTAKIADATITNAKIQDLSVDTAKIANGAITTAKIGNAQITRAKIDDLSVNNAKIDNLTVGGEKFVWNATSNTSSANGASGFIELPLNVRSGSRVVIVATTGGDFAGTGNEYLRIYSPTATLRRQLTLQKILHEDGVSLIYAPATTIAEFEATTNYSPLTVMVTGPGQLTAFALEMFK